MKVTVEKVHTIKEEDFSNLLTTALEGGSNYWCLLPDLAACREWNAKTGDGKRLPMVDMIHKYIWHGNGSVLIVDRNSEEYKPEHWVIDKASVENGFKLFIEMYHDEWMEFKDGSYDADVADVWFQLVVIGEVMFG